ncbi:MAG: HNH endonuclease [Nitrospirota bacterium]
MPYAAAKPCKSPGCPALTRGRFCGEHAQAHASRRAAQDERPSPSKRGYDTHWRHLRANFLRKFPACIVCGAPATDVDHIMALAAGGSHHSDNLQALCKSCHARKTAMHDRGFGNKQVAI